MSLNYLGGLHPPSWATPPQHCLKTLETSFNLGHAEVHVGVVGSIVFKVQAWAHSYPATKGIPLHTNIVNAQSSKDVGDHMCVPFPAGAVSGTVVT